MPWKSREEFLGQPPQHLPMVSISHLGCAELVPHCIARREREEVRMESRPVLYCVSLTNGAQVQLTLVHVQGNLADALRGIGVEEDPSRFADSTEVTHGLHCSYFVVAVHDLSRGARGERRRQKNETVFWREKTKAYRNQRRVLLDGLLHVVHSNSAVRSHWNLRISADALGLVGAEALDDRRVLDVRSHHVRWAGASGGSPSRPLERPLDGPVVRLGPARNEEHLGRLAAQEVRDPAPRPIARFLARAAEGVRAARVPEHREEGEHLLGDLGVYRRRGVPIEVDGRRGHGRTPPGARRSGSCWSHRSRTPPVPRVEPLLPSMIDDDRIDENAFWC